MRALDPGGSFWLRPKEALAKKQFPYLNLIRGLELRKHFLPVLKSGLFDLIWNWLQTSFSDTRCFFSFQRWPPLRASFVGPSPDWNRISRFEGSWHRMTPKKLTPTSNASKIYSAFVSHSISWVQAFAMFELIRVPSKTFFYEFVFIGSRGGGPSASSGKSPDFHGPWK